MLVHKQYTIIACYLLLKYISEKQHHGQQSSLTNKQHAKMKDKQVLLHTDGWAIYTNPTIMHFLSCCYRMMPQICYLLKMKCEHYSNTEIFWILDLLLKLYHILRPHYKNTNIPTFFSTFSAVCQSPVYERPRHYEFILWPGSILILTEIQ